MRVYIYGTEFRNKGAELMLRSIVEELATWPERIVTASHLRMGRRRQRRALGLWDVAEIRGRRWDRLPFLSWTVDTAAGFVPQRVRERRRILRRGEVDLVLDASGFAYSDQWSSRTVEVAAARYQAMREDGTQVVLLPQAFGPFRTRRTREAMVTILHASTLVFARDATSFSELKALDGSTDHVHMAPDFTTGIHGVAPDWAAHLSERPCVVPNRRMIDKTDPDVAQWYRDCTYAVLAELTEAGEAPFLLVHETDDAPLARELSAEASVPVIIESNPVRLKGILGGASFVFGARYHALIGSLAQEVPTLGVGWSHKYHHLFEDYTVPDCLVTKAMSMERIKDKVRMLAGDETVRRDLATRLHAGATRQAGGVSTMWSQLRAQIKAP